MLLLFCTGVTEQWKIPLKGVVALLLTPRWTVRSDRRCALKRSGHDIQCEMNACAHLSPQEQCQNDRTRMVLGPIHTSQPPPLRWWRNDSVVKGKVDPSRSSGHMAQMPQAHKSGIHVEQWKTHWRKWRLGVFGSRSYPGTQQD
jgi:hypothetical protein